MKKSRKIAIVLVFLVGAIIFSIGFPDQSLAYRTDTINGVIDFDMRMDDGSLIPVGKVPTAEVDYGIRTLIYYYSNPGGIYTFLSDNEISTKTITIPYNGSGTFSATETGNFTYGIRKPSDPVKSKTDAVDVGHAFRNLKFTNVPAYIRSISAKSTVLGDYTSYRQSYTDYEVPESTFPADDSSNYFGQVRTYTSIPNPNLIKTGPGNFEYTGSHVGPGVNYSNGVEFGFNGGGGVMDYVAPRYRDRLYNYSSVGANGKKITFFMKGFQTNEIFRDQDGNHISPPSGFSQMKRTDADEDVYTHTMDTLPTSYVVGGYMYVLQGWYQGTMKPVILEATNPPSVTIDYTQPKTITELDAEGVINVIYKKSFAVNEKYVDESDTTINGGAWDTVVPVAPNDPFNGSPTATKTDSSGDDWEYVGWKIGSGGTVNTSPVTIPSVTGNEDIYYIYKRSKTTATLDLTPTPKIVNNNDSISWTSRLTNTGNAPLKDLILKATSNWSADLTEPVQVTVTPAGGTAQSFTVNPGDWPTGVSLTGITIPNGGANNYADITFTTTASGAVNQVLPAEIEVAGNIPTPIKADDFVRIDDPDEPNLEPSGNAGLINIPDFRFGDVEVKPFAQTKGLDTTAYQSGYNPYIRFMDNESTGGWSLTAKLGQFTSGSKTLPTTTAIKLKNGVLMEVQNYNKSNENLNYVDLAGSVNIPSDGTTVALTNKSNQGVYQLEYDINTGVELELMAHSGIAGLSYTADMDWTLTTAP